MSNLKAEEANGLTSVETLNTGLLLSAVFRPLELLRQVIMQQVP